MKNPTQLPPFVSMEWCNRRREGLVVADTRWYLDGSSGSDAYHRGHLPGAVFVDLDRWLSGDASGAGGRNPLPDPEVFSAGMSGLGISDTDTVVAYDDAGGVIAARLVWMLRALGSRAAILDGGLAAYSGPLETVPAARKPTPFSVRPWPDELLADIEDVVSGDFLVADARNRDRYEGRQDPVDPRPGHVPGAISFPCRENLDPRGRLLPSEDRRQRARTAGIETAQRLISYCGSGVTACHNLLTLEHLGWVGGDSSLADGPNTPGTRLCR